MNREGTLWDTVIAKNLPLSETVSDGDLEHSTRGRPELVRTSPVRSYLMQHFHSREAAAGCRTHENYRLLLVENPRSEQTFWPYRAHCWAHRSEGFPRTRITKSSCACDCGRGLLSSFFLLCLLLSPRIVP